MVSPVAGTTRDVIETPLALDGIALRFSDTAGIRGQGGDAFEANGIDRAKGAVEGADIQLWVGSPRDDTANTRYRLLPSPADRRTRHDSELGSAACGGKVLLSV